MWRPEGANPFQGRFRRGAPGFRKLQNPNLMGAWLGAWLGAWH
jgi:hypothetical protein